MGCGLVGVGLLGEGRRCQLTDSRIRLEAIKTWMKLVSLVTTEMAGICESWEKFEFLSL